MEKINLWLWFDNKKGLSKKNKINLYEKFENIHNIYEATKQDYENCGIKLSNEVIESLCKKNFDFEYLTQKYKELNIKPVSIDMEEYPKMLKDTGEAPVVIYCRGKFIDLNKKMCVSVVGARKLSVYGKTHGYNIAKQMAQKGAIIVSGMAYGIDTMAHLGALDADMPTVAVLGCGPDVVYPASNRKLMERIMKTGIIIREYPLGTPAHNYNFPERNKIVAGLSIATIVIEASIKSGSLITAELAEKYKRKVFSVPGNIDEEHSKGTNYLIKKGAGLITCGDDVINSFPEHKDKLTKEEIQTNEYNDMKNVSPEENKILSCLGKQPVSIDYICEKSGIDIAVLNSKLLIMELQGKIEKHPGNRYSKEGRI